MNSAQTKPLTYTPSAPLINVSVTDGQMKVIFANDDYPYDIDLEEKDRKMEEEWDRQVEARLNWEDERGW